MKATAAFVALAVLAAPALSGCSFLFSEGAPADHARRATFTCGDGYAPPVLDTIATGVYGFAALSAALSKEATVAMAADPAAKRRELNAAIGAAIVIATVDAASAAYGYEATGTCRDANAERAVMLARARLLPSPYGVPPIGEPPPYWPPAPAAPPAPGVAPSQVPAPAAAAPVVPVPPLVPTASP